MGSSSSASLDGIGTEPIDSRSFAGVARTSKLLGRGLLLASPAPHTLAPRAAEAFGIPVLSLEQLPNPIVDRPRQRMEPVPDRPRMVFLGRLDPIKRPWLFVELARRFEGIDFLLLGDAYVKGSRWVPSNLPCRAGPLGSTV